MRRATVILIIMLLMPVGAMAKDCAPHRSFWQRLGHGVKVTMLWIGHVITRNGL